MDFVHVLNLLLWAIAAPSRTFSAPIWSIAAQSSRRTAQSIFNHGYRFKSTFRKVPESQQGASTSAGNWIKNEDKERPAGRCAGTTQPQPSSCSPRWIPVHWESTFFPCLHSLQLVIFMHQLLLSAGPRCCCSSSCPVTLHWAALRGTKQKCSNAFLSQTHAHLKESLPGTRIHLMHVTIYIYIF